MIHRGLFSNKWKVPKVKITSDIAEISRQQNQLLMFGKITLQDLPPEGIEALEEPQIDPWALQLVLEKFKNSM